MKEKSPKKSDMEQLAAYQARKAKYEAEKTELEKEYESITEPVRSGKKEWFTKDEVDRLQEIQNKLVELDENIRICNEYIDIYSSGTPSYAWQEDPEQVFSVAELPKDAVAEVVQALV